MISAKAVVEKAQQTLLEPRFANCIAFLRLGDLSMVPYVNRSARAIHQARDSKLSA